MIVRLNLKRLKITRNELIEKMARRGVGCSVHYRPIHTLSFFRRLGLAPQRYAEAEKAGRSVVSLPLYPGLNPADVDLICDSLIALCRRHAR
jgi:dTDP-4-amino-4,6-dideoxygalactose transaminase